VWEGGVVVLMPFLFSSSDVVFIPKITAGPYVHHTPFLSAGHGHVCLSSSKLVFRSVGHVCGACRLLFGFPAPYPSFPLLFLFFLRSVCSVVTRYPLTPLSPLLLLSYRLSRCGLLSLPPCGMYALRPSRAACCATCSQRWRQRSGLSTSLHSLSPPPSPSYMPLSLRLCSLVLSRVATVASS